jgi:hypothetical protein
MAGWECPPRRGKFAMASEEEKHPELLHAKHTPTLLHCGTVIIIHTRYYNSTFLFILHDYIT